MDAHDANTPKLQALGEVEDRAPLHQRREGRAGSQLSIPVVVAFAAEAGETLRPMMRFALVGRSR